MKLGLGLVTVPNFEPVGRRISEIKKVCSKTCRFRAD